MLETPNSLNDSKKHLNIYKRNIFKRTKKVKSDKQNRRLLY